MKNRLDRLVNDRHVIIDAWVSSTRIFLKQSRLVGDLVIAEDRSLSVESLNFKQQLLSRFCVIATAGEAT